MDLLLWVCWFGEDDCKPSISWPLLDVFFLLFSVYLHRWGLGSGGVYMGSISLFFFCHVSWLIVWPRLSLGGVLGVWIASHRKRVWRVRFQEDEFDVVMYLYLIITLGFYVMR